MIELVAVLLLLLLPATAVFPAGSGLFAADSGTSSVQMALFPDCCSSHTDRLLLLL